MIFLKIHVLVSMCMYSQVTLLIVDLMIVALTIFQHTRDANTCEGSELTTRGKKKGR